jgi:hypothetical protein
MLPDDTSYVYRALSIVGLTALVPPHVSIEAALGTMVGMRQARLAGLSPIAARGFETLFAGILTSVWLSGIPANRRFMSVR